MNITNKYNLPVPLVNATSWGIRDIKENTISVTQLIDSPQIFQLRKKHEYGGKPVSLLVKAVHYGVSIFSRPIWRARQTDTNLRFWLYLPFMYVLEFSLFCGLLLGFLKSKLGFLTRLP